MTVFDQLRGHEQILFGSDEPTGLRCIIAIHSTALGPALGGTRFQPYATEDEALTDVLRLSRGMTLKAACAGLDLGGGKAVIIGDPRTERTEACLRAYGRMVDSLGGRYVTACDVGTFPADMELVRRETRWATGMAPVHGGSGDSGVLTARGVFVGIRAAAHHRWGTDDLSGRHVAVQGLGKVGRRVVDHLLEVGAKVTATDVWQPAVDAVAERGGVDLVDPDRILDVDADILSPNALGGVLTADTIPRLRVEVVCGGANNQLGTDADAERLRAAGILYAPDYVVNAGGVIAVSDELHRDGHSPERSRRRTDEIGDRLGEILRLADAEGTTTEAAAAAYATRRIEAVGGLRRIQT